MSAEIDRLLAYEEIRQLAAHYAVAVDSRDADAIVALFTPDVKVLGGGRGRDALRQVFEQHLRSDRVSILHVGTHMIDLVDADHATGIVYSICEMGDEYRWARQAIAYEDRYERHEGRWYFARRDHKLFYGVELDERPLAQADANWPASAIGRGSVPYDWPTWQRFWGEGPPLDARRGMGESSASSGKAEAEAKTGDRTGHAEGDNSAGDVAGRQDRLLHPAEGPREEEGDASHA